MSLLPSIPRSLLTDGLSTLYPSGNPNNNSSSNHNHYHSTNQYHHHNHAHNQHDSSLHSQLLNTPSVLFLQQFNQTNNQPEEPIAAESAYSDNFNNHNSNSILSFLYSGNGDFSPTSTSFTNNLQSTTDFPPGYYDVPDEDSVQDAFVEGSHLWALLVVGYSIVFTIGVIGNSVLLAALCGSGGRARALPVRNHLMVNLAISDLLVTGVSVPISACAAASHACWPNFLVSWMCQLGPMLTRTPVAASTLSLALLSLDRWAAIKHPRFAQRFRERRFVAMSMTVIWALASLVSVPTFWARNWNDYTSSLPYETPPQQEKSPDDLFDKGNSSSWGQWNGSGVCVERWANIGIQLAYAATYLGTAFVSPALIVAACHASVSHKLTAQLKVLATSGDRLSASRTRPKQVLIVARDPSNNIIPNPLSPMGEQNGLNGGNVSRSGSMDYHSRPSQSRKFVPCDPNSDDDDDVFVRLQIDADLESFRQLSQLQSNRTDKASGSRRGVKLLSTFRSNLGSEEHNSDNNNILKASKRETSIIKAHRKLRKQLNVSSAAIPLSSNRLTPTPLLPTYSSQSFRSRRRAANLLAALAAVFVFCWLPYVTFAILEMFLQDKSLVRQLIPFALFLGHLHSSINPVVSWRLNRSAFVRFQRQSLFSLLPEWFRSFFSCQLFCYSCSCTPTCCDNVNEEFSSTPGPRTFQRPPLRRAGTQYPMNNQNPFINPQQQRRIQRGRGRQSGWCCNNDEDSDEGAFPCCCCFCSNRMFGRRSSSPDMWNRNSSTGTGNLGAFHPKYLNRLPAPDPVSKCHTSNFFR